MSRFKDYTDGIDALEYCLGGKLETLMLKGLLYEKLSEELGCPLEVVIKALKEGIIYEKDKENKYVLIPNLIYTELIDDEFPDYRFVNYDLQNLENSSYVKLKDYQKTWFLEGEKE